MTIENMKVVEIVMISTDFMKAKRMFTKKFYLSKRVPNEPKLI